MENPLVLLFGGTSSERRVSVASAQYLAGHLADRPCRHWFIAPDGAVHECSAARLRDHTQPFERDFEPGTPAAWPRLDVALDQSTERIIGGSGGRGAVFVLALHGGTGEDGTLQHALERRHLAFTGSGSEASARAFDKSVAKSLVAARGVHTVPGAVLPAGDEAGIARALDELCAAHGALMVKPVADGSSVGLHAIHTRAEIAPVAAAVAADGAAYLAEALVSGTEVTVGVVDDEDGPHALPLTEIRVATGRMFDYEGKYLGSGTEEITPAQVAPEVAAAASRAALLAHQALGCEGYSRTDFIVADDRPVFLETNTLPGLTRASLIPQQLAAAGRSMGGFVDRQIALAIQRRDQRVAA